MSFKTIETQEQLDAIITERLERQKESLLKPYADYESIKKENGELKTTLSTLQSELDGTKGLSEQVNELTEKVKEYETNSLKVKYALEHGIPYKFASRISGATEDEIKADAESLKEVFKSAQPAAPLKNTETNSGSSQDTAYKQMLKEIEGE